MQSLINNMRFEVNNNIIRLHWQMSARNGQLLWYHSPLIIRLYVDPFDKVTLPNPILHHMDAANYEVTHGVETSAVVVTGTRSETIRAFHPSGRYNSNADGNWYEIKIDTNHEKISKSADHIAPFLEWNITIGTDFVVEAEIGYFEKSDFISVTELIGYEHKPKQIEEYLKSLKQYVQSYLDWQIISPLGIGGSSERQKPMMNLRFSPRLAEHLKNAPFDSFEEVFEQLDNRVLLLGEPGAGKTITALLLAKQAIENRQVSSAAPLPFYARIPNWLNEQLPLHEWLARDTPLSSNFMRQQLESGNCLLILDGLDELGSERYEEGENGYQANFDPRKRFLNVLNNQPSKNQLLLTCRIDDYSEIGSEIKNIGGKATLKRLEDSQIRDYLISTKVTQQLWNALRVKSDLLDIVRTPLLLSLFAFAYRELPEQIRELKDLSKVELRDAIFERYIARRYEHEAEKFQVRGVTPPFSLEDVKFGLGFFATLDAVDRPYLEWRDAATGLNIDTSYAKPEFIEFAVNLHLGTFSGKNRVFRFIHLLLRDYLIYQFCIQILDARYLDYEYRLYVIEAASRLYDSRLVMPILKHLRHQDEAIRVWAKNALITLSGLAWRPLIDALKTETNEVRIQIIPILREIGNKNAIPVLIELLRDDELGSEALRQLLKDPFDTTEQLVRALQTDDNVLKARIIEALGYSIPKTIRFTIRTTTHPRHNPVTRLIDLLKDNSPAFKRRICDFAATTLEEIGTPEALEAVRKWREENNTQS